jgi:thiol-disulfide isomerase/thioredoxin
MPARKILFLTMISIAVLIASSEAMADGKMRDARRWTVVNYWSITCAPCRIEIPELNQLREELETVDIGLVGVNFDEDDRGRTLALAERMGIEFPTLKQAQVDALNVVPPSVLPTTLILSPDGTEKVRLIGAQTRESIKFELGQLLGEEG